jgi:hypothetical protein
MGLHIKHPTFKPRNSFFNDSYVLYIALIISFRLKLNKKNQNQNSRISVEACENFTLIQDLKVMRSSITYYYVQIHNFCPGNQLYRRMSHQNHSTLSVILDLYRPVVMRLRQHIIFFQH